MGPFSVTTWRKDEVTAAMRALGRVRLDHFDRMAADLDALVTPLGLGSELCGADLASAVRAVRQWLASCDQGPEELKPQRQSICVMLEAGGLERWWGPVALFEELSGVGVMSFAPADSPSPEVQSGAAGAAFLAVCTCALVPWEVVTASQGTSGWDLVVTDVASNPDGPPECATRVVVVVGATDAAEAAWAPACAWHLRYHSLLLCFVNTN